LPPQAEDDDDEAAAEGEQDADDVDTVCRSILPTMPREHPRRAEREREGGEKTSLLAKTRQQHTERGRGRGRDLLGFILVELGLCA
jgi:hypothetical protein